MRRSILAAAALPLAVPAIPAEAHRTGFKHSHGAYHQVHGRNPSISGGAGGAPLGRESTLKGSRSEGTVLGAAVGALLGRHVERNLPARRCR